MAKKSKGTYLDPSGRVEPEATKDNGTRSPLLGSEAAGSGRRKKTMAAAAAHALGEKGRGEERMSGPSSLAGPFWPSETRAGAASSFPVWARPRIQRVRAVWTATSEKVVKRQEANLKSDELERPALRVPNRKAPSVIMVKVKNPRRRRAAGDKMRRWGAVAIRWGEL